MQFSQIRWKIDATHIETGSQHIVEPNGQAIVLVFEDPTKVFRD